MVQNVFEFCSVICCSENSVINLMLKKYSYTWINYNVKDREEIFDKSSLLLTVSRIMYIINCILQIVHCNWCTANVDCIIDTTNCEIITEQPEFDFTKIVPLPGVKERESQL